MLIKAAETGPRLYIYFLGASCS